MRAALITGYQRPLELVTVADPELLKDGIIMKVRATGVCRSDWHTWMGHYGDQIAPPMIPGHEMAGDVLGWPDVTGISPGAGNSPVRATPAGVVILALTATIRVVPRKFSQAPISTAVLPE